MLLGPPLLIALAVASAAVIPNSRLGVRAGALPNPRAIAECANAAPAAAAVNARPDRAAQGSWWRLVPVTDSGGTLTDWTLTVGASDARAATFTLPPASFVSGPDHGRLVIAEDDGARSAVRVLDVAGGCARTLDLGAAIARRAVTDPGRDAVLVHLLDRSSRADLGTWRVPLNGGDLVRVLAPIPDAALRAAGISQVWATTLLTSSDGSQLAVQSCDPVACVTRILDLGTGDILIIDGAHGELVGFAGDRLVSMGACGGPPCEVLSWDLATGVPATLETAAIGAAVSRDGRVVVAVRDSGAEAHVLAIDASSGSRESLGVLDAGTVPLGGMSAVAGLETALDAVGLVRDLGQPFPLELGPRATSPVTRPLETQP
jgi:hypothetical protein